LKVNTGNVVLLLKQKTMSEWSFITTHGLVLASIAKHPRSTAREIGDMVGVTERTAHKIILDLEEAGYITKTKVGRKNKYTIHSDMPLAEEASDADVGQLLVMLGWKRRRSRSSAETLA
jgi:DNA-binding Lrp family transcriptional regulator